MFRLYMLVMRLVTVVALASLAGVSIALASIVDELGPRLSLGATIAFPDSSEFLIATDRDHEQNPPTYAVMVEVATQKDVQKTVWYANSHNISFLATTGLHGGTTTLGKLCQGINISMRKLNSIVISEDGNSAIFGGGILGLEARDGLWAAGKQTVTGACECVGLVGPLLGGGHGYLQGFYGLISDNLLSARVVLASGDAVTVSAGIKSDLFWALQGAGHNFGVITEVDMRVYDVPAAGWAYIQYVFTRDKVEAVFARLNSLAGNGTNATLVNVINKNVFARTPVVDPDNVSRQTNTGKTLGVQTGPTDRKLAVIILNIFYQGAVAVPAEYTAPLLAIGPVVAAANATDYPGLTLIDGTDINNAVCQQHDAANMMFPISLKSYSIPAQRAAFDAFNAFTADATFANSAVLFEAYSTQAVRAVSSDSTAFPFREDNIFITPVVSYAVNSTLDAKAIAFGNSFRQTLNEADGGREMHAYVNFAHGDETLEEVYGYEPWRVARLKALKKKYDPLGRFDYYAPV